MQKKLQLKLNFWSHTKTTLHNTHTLCHVHLWPHRPHSTKLRLITKLSCCKLGMYWLTFIVNGTYIIMQNKNSLHSNWILIVSIVIFEYRDIYCTDACTLELCLEKLATHVFKCAYFTTFHVNFHYDTCKWVHTCIYMLF